MRRGSAAALPASAFAAAGAARPGAAAAGCRSARDCFYNGACAGGVCACARGWVGAACSELDLRPAPAKGVYGYDPNVTSWGGTPPLRAGGAYHMYVSEITGGCGLSAWWSNSRIVHATSPTPRGPFAFRDEAVGHWSHGPSIAVDETGPQPKYLLFRSTQQGLPGGPHGAPVRCANSTGPGGEGGAGDASILHVADSPDGPWTAVRAPGIDGHTGLASMPHAHIFKNGTLYVVLQGNGQPQPSFEGWKAFRAPSWKGPYSPVNVTFVGDPGYLTTAGCWEDPFVWYDDRAEVWKMLMHAGFWDPQNPDARCSSVPEPHCCVATRSGGFAYSEDGETWVRSPTPPFNTTVANDDGTMSIFSSRERPKLLFDHNLSPIALYTSAVGGDPTKKDYSCRLVPGVDWTFTHMQPIGPP